MAPPRPARGRARRLVVAASALAVLATMSCQAEPAAERSAPEDSGGGSSRPHVTVTLPPPEPGIHLSFVQQRIDEATRLVGLRVENITDATLHVRRVGLDWAGYGAFTVPARHAVPAGATLDLPFRLPPERCGASVDARPVGVLVAARRTIRRRVDDMGVRFAERLWRAGCTARRLGRAATFSYGPPWRVEGRGRDMILSTSLRVTRLAGSEPITLLDAQGTVLFDLRPTGRTVVPGTEPSGRLPLAITPGRCDEHARSQASQPFTFRLFLRLGSDPSTLSLVLPPSRGQQRSLLRFLDRACASD